MKSLTLLCKSGANFSEAPETSLDHDFILQGTRAKIMRVGQQQTKLLQYIPAGFKYSYIVPVPKPNDCRTKAMTCDDFRAIAYTDSPILSKVFEHCFLCRFQCMFETTDNQFGFKKGVSCSHAIYSVYNIVKQATSNGSSLLSTYVR